MHQMWVSSNYNWVKYFKYYICLFANSNNKQDTEKSDRSFYKEAFFTPAYPLRNVPDLVLASSWRVSAAACWPIIPSSVT